MLICFGREVDLKHGGDRKRPVLTFLTINESRKWSHLKMSSFSNEIPEQELTLVRYRDSIHHDLKKEGMGERKERRNKPPTCIDPQHSNTKNSDFQQTQESLKTEIHSNQPASWINKML